MHSQDEIFQGFQDNEFFLEYQPYVSLADGSCIGAEALIRWQKGDRLLPPCDFLPQIYNTWLIGFLSCWLIDEIARDLGEWLHKTSDVHISFNVPPELFGRGGLVYVAYRAGLHEISNKLVVEITEKGIPDKLGIEMINNRDSYMPEIKFALDDVSPADEISFALLARLNLDVIKIDKSFVDKIPLPGWSESREASVLYSIGQSNCLTVAEGVETAKQAEVVRNAGILAAQGWYYSRSIRASEFIEYHRLNSGK